MIVLAIDPGKKSGWAVIRHGVLVAYGSVSPMDRDARDRVVKTACALARDDFMKPGHKQVQIVIEEFGGAPKNSRKTLIGIGKSIGLWEEAIKHAGCSMARIKRPTATQWRKRLFGTGNPKDPKGWAHWYVWKRYGVSVASHDQREAICLARWLEVLWGES